MKPIIPALAINRRVLLSTLAVLPALSASCGSAVESNSRSPIHLLHAIEADIWSMPAMRNVLFRESVGKATFAVLGGTVRPADAFP
jgi:hypothetical protein